MEVREIEIDAPWGKIAVTLMPNSMWWYHMIRVCQAETCHFHFEVELDVIECFHPDTLNTMIKETGGQIPCTENPAPGLFLFSYHAKLWGHEDAEPVLTIHGVQDNAGSFDGLIPLLPEFFYICIDLPGHGKSTHFPPHTPIYTLNYLMVYTIVMDYFQKTKYIIMGHSYGAQIGFVFSRMYPERVKKLIMFDAVHMYLVPEDYYTKYLVDRYSKQLEIEKKMKTRSAPEYTYQEAFEKIMQNRQSPLTEKATKSLLERILIPASDGKYFLSTDQRLKHFINPLHNIKYVLESLNESSVRCPILLVFGADNRAQRQILRPILRYLKKQKNVTCKYVQGHHDVHQNDPELVAPHVVEFLGLQKSKL